MSGKIFGLLSILALVIVGQTCLSSLPGFPIGVLSLIAGGLALLLILVYVVFGN